MRTFSDYNTCIQLHDCTFQEMTYILTMFAICRKSDNRTSFTLIPIHCLKTKFAIPFLVGFYPPFFLIFSFLFNILHVILTEVLCSLQDLNWPIPPPMCSQNLLRVSKDDVSAGSGARHFLSRILEPVLVPDMLGARLKVIVHCCGTKVSSLQDHLGNLHLPKTLKR